MAKYIVDHRQGVGAEAAALEDGVNARRKRVIPPDAGRRQGRARNGEQACGRAGPYARDG